MLIEGFNEDLAGLVGAHAAETDRRTPTQVARLRLPWLLGTMAIELLAGGIIARFGHVALASVPRAHSPTAHSPPEPRAQSPEPEAVQSPKPSRA